MLGKRGRCRRSWSAIGAVRSTCYTRPSTNMSKEETCQKLSLPGWPEFCTFFFLWGGLGSTVWEVHDGRMAGCKRKLPHFQMENISRPASFFRFTMTKWWFWTLGWDLPRPVVSAKGAGGQSGERRIAMPPRPCWKHSSINVYRCCMFFFGMILLY